MPRVVSIRKIPVKAHLISYMSYGLSLFIYEFNTTRGHKDLRGAKLTPV